MAASDEPTGGVFNVRAIVGMRRDSPFLFWRTEFESVYRTRRDIAQKAVGES